MKTLPILTTILIAALLVNCSTRQRRSTAATEVDSFFGEALVPYSNPNSSGFSEDIPLPSRPENGLNFFGPDVDRDVYPPVYFGFNDYGLTSEEFDKVMKVVEYMRGDSVKVILAGHTDTVGTSEYNRNLGELRSITVRTVLVDMGVSPDRVHTVSYGEEFPAKRGNSEDAHNANRRVEFGFFR